MEKCIFCKIINKEAPADIIYENRKIIAFKDIFPKAPFHILIVPKKHILTIDHIDVRDKNLIGDIFLAAREISRQLNVSKKGYRLIFNVGRDAGQTVDHLHLHLLAGKELPFA